MSPEDFEKQVQAHGPHMLKRLISLSKSRKHHVALQAMRLLLPYAYGNAGTTQRDPWEDAKGSDAFADAVRHALNHKPKPQTAKKGNVIKIKKPVASK